MIYKVSIEGSEEDIAEFAKTLEGGVFKFSQIIPEPEDLKDIHVGYCKTVSQHFSRWRVIDGKEVTVSYDEEDWYQWRMKNWGVPYDIAVLIHESSNSSCICFNYESNVRSCITYPDKWFKSVSLKHPNLKFWILYSGLDFIGMSITGFVEISNGGVIKEVEEINR